MIVRRLTKFAEPPVLQANKAAWTQEYANAVAAGQKPLPSRYRNPEIVHTLRDETASKCAYCEGVIADVSYPHVEHMRPKSARPDLVVEWSNLTVGCTVCNTHKSDYYAEQEPLVHPYEHDPESHIAFRGPAVFSALEDAIGERTIVRLQLMRAALLAERLKRIQGLHELLQRWSSATGPDKDVREIVVRDALSPDQEFVTCLRAHAAAFGFPV